MTVHRIPAHLYNETQVSCFQHDTDPIAGSWAHLDSIALSGRIQNQYLSSGSWLQAQIWSEEYLECA